MGVKGQAHTPCFLAKENPSTGLTPMSPRSPAPQPSHSAGHCQPPNPSSPHASPSSALLPLVSLPISPICYQRCWAQQSVGTLVPPVSGYTDPNPACAEQGLPLSVQLSTGTAAGLCKSHTGQGAPTIIHGLVYQSNNKALVILFLRK